MAHSTKNAQVAQDQLSTVNNGLTVLSVLRCVRITRLLIGVSCAVLLPSPWPAFRLFCAGFLVGSFSSGEFFLRYLEDPIYCAVESSRCVRAFMVIAVRGWLGHAPSPKRT